MPNALANHRRQYQGNALAQSMPGNPQQVTEYGIPDPTAYDRYLRGQAGSEIASGLGNYAMAAPLALGGGTIAALGPTGLDKLFGLMMLTGAYGYGTSGNDHMRQAIGLEDIRSGASQRQGMRDPVSEYGDQFSAPEQTFAKYEQF